MPIKSSTVRDENELENIEVNVTGGWTWISSSSSSSCLGLMIIWVLTLASSLSSLRVLASEASEDNAAVLTFKSRNLFRSSQAFAKKRSLIYTVKIISMEITNYI